MKIKTFILKIASHCNLNCSYCHMYNMGDNTYKNQPKFLSDENIIAFSEKLKNYSKKHKIENVFIAFHGGEPLLIAKSTFIFYVETILNHNKHLNITFIIQTNGVLLNNEWAEILKKYNVNVGISLDGDKKVNDTYRVKHNGKGSYDEIISNLIEIDSHEVVKGIISVVNTHIDPVYFYSHMKEINKHQLNILLPNINFSNIPDFYMPVEDHMTKSKNWLIELYEVWKNDAERLSIPFFELIIKLIAGARNFGNHLIGNCENGVAVIETNGDIEVIDALRTSFSGATRGNLNVLNNEIEEIHDHQLFTTYYYSHTQQLPTLCKSCNVKNICGGGFLVHRYKDDCSTFNNPSIYCSVLKNVIKYIQKDLYYEIN
jgi:uncharacterized protein